MHVSNMLLQAQQWIEKTHPAAWNRRGGRDHIWLSPNDEGAAKSLLCSQSLIITSFSSANPSLMTDDGRAGKQGASRASHLKLSTRRLHADAASCGRGATLSLGGCMAAPGTAGHSESRLLTHESRLFLGGCWTPDEPVAGRHAEPLGRLKSCCACWQDRIPGLSRHGSKHFGSMPLCRRLLDTQRAVAGRHPEPLGPPRRRARLQHGIPA